MDNVRPELKPEELLRSSHRFPIKNCKWNVDNIVLDRLKKYKKEKLYSVLEDLDLEDLNKLPFRPAPFNEEAARKGIAKYFIERPELRNLEPEQVQAYDKAVDALYCHFQCLKGSVVESHEDYLQGYVKSTSPGAFYSHMYKNERGVSSKEAFVLHREDDLHNFFESLGKGLGHANTCWAMNLKKELVKAEKVQLNKTRAFLGASVFSDYVGRRLFSNMADKLHKAKTWNWTGNSQWYRGFEDLWNRLTCYSYLGAGDGANWDGSVLAELMLEIAKFRYSMLTDRDKTPETWARILNYYRDVIFSMCVLMDGSIYIKTGAMPSGCFTTIDDNSLIGFILLTYSYFRRNPNHSYKTMMDNMTAALCGDDNIFGCNPKYFDIKDLQSYSLELGMTYTNEGLSRKDIEFCSSKFKPCHCYDEWGMECPIVLADLRYNKMICSLIYNDGACSIALSLEKICNQLPNTFPDPSTYALYRRLYNDIVNEELGGFDAKSSQYLSPSTVYNMWHGYEK